MTAFSKPRMTMSILAVSAAVLLAGCNSFGAKRVGPHRYAPTDARQVALFSLEYPELGIPPRGPYDVIGKIDAAYYFGDGLSEKFRKLAARLGADAVSIQPGAAFLFFGDAIKYRDPALQLPPKKRW